MRSARFSLRPFALGAAAALLSAALSGCHLFHRGHAEAAVKPHVTLASQVAPMLPVDLTKVQPNEAGLVPILEYHDLVSSLKTTGLSVPRVRVPQGHPVAVRPQLPPGQPARLCRTAK